MTEDRTMFDAASRGRALDSASGGGRVRRQGGAALAVLAVVAVVGAVALAGGRLPGSDNSTGSASQPMASPATAAASPTVPAPPPGAEVVYVDAPEWTCSEPADEKFTCSQGEDAVAVNWRPAADRPAYLHPAKADVVDDVHTWVSEVHGEFFVTVTPVPGATQEQVDQVGAALVWVD